MKAKVLVTGGSGFLGSALVKRLLADGYSVSVLDDNSRGSATRLETVLDDINFLQGDVRNPDIVDKAVKDVDWIYHLAFINGTRYFYEKPGPILDVGIRGALNTMDSAQKYGVSKYILASSSEVYNEPQNIPTDENERAIIPDVKNPRFSYGGGKLISELLTFHYLRNVTTKIVFRPHNVYGPDMGWEHVIPDLMRKTRTISQENNSKDLDFPIQGSGSETRAFCFIDDATDGILRLSEYGENNEIFHLGTNEEISIRNLVHLIGETTGFNLKIQSSEAPEGGTSRRCPDISKLSKLGYNPSVSLSEGLNYCWDWYSKAELPSAK